MRKILDEFTDLPVSKQRKHQLRKARDGRCLYCEQPAIAHYLCGNHLERTRNAVRERTGVRRQNKNALIARLLAAAEAPATKPSDYLPDEFELDLKCASGPHHRLRFRRRQLYYSMDEGSGFSAEQPLALGPIRWQAFWLALEAHRVWEWQMVYEATLPFKVEWELFIARRKQKVHSKGHDALPGLSGPSKSMSRMGPFLAALRQLTRVRTIRIEAPKFDI